MRDFFVRILSEEKYDFLLLQEFDVCMKSIFDSTHSSYNILQIFDEDLGEQSQVCIVYKNTYILKQSSLISFSTFDTARTPHGWGFISGVFDVGGESIIIGSTHLHSGIKTSVRIRELARIKENLLLSIKDNQKIFFSGDFNTGFWYEILNCDRVLSPEFIRISKKLPSTLDSRYTEPAHSFLNTIARVLATYGFGIRLTTDHIYCRLFSPDTSQIHCKVLTDRVSDHSPVECSIPL